MKGMNNDLVVPWKQHVHFFLLLEGYVNPDGMSVGEQLAHFYGVVDWEKEGLLSVMDVATLNYLALFQKENLFELLEVFFFFNFNFLKFYLFIFLLFLFM